MLGLYRGQKLPPHNCGPAPKLLFPAKLKHQPGPNNMKRDENGVVAPKILDIDTLDLPEIPKIAHKLA